MSRAAKFLVQVSTVDFVYWAGYTNKWRACTKTKWETVTRCDSLAEAAELAETHGRRYLYWSRVTFKSKTVWPEQR